MRVNSLIALAQLYYFAGYYAIARAAFDAAFLRLCIYALPCAAAYTIERCHAFCLPDSPLLLLPLMRATRDERCQTRAHAVDIAAAVATPPTATIYYAA